MAVIFDNMHMLRDTLARSLNGLADLDDADGQIDILGHDITTVE